MDIEMLKKHSSIVMHSLAAAIESLDESEALNSVLLEVGRLHVRRNVKTKTILVRWIQHYVIKFVSDLRQISGFLQTLRFPLPIKLTATIYLKYC
jgi:hypothetical protein